MLAFDDEGNEISLAPAKETRSEPVTQTAHQGLDPEKRALLDTIAGGESPGYNAMYTGKGSVRRFTDFSDHPRSGDRISKGPNAGQTSSAAGRYQFTPSTWDRQAEKLGLPNFRPEHQDVAAADLAETTYGKRLLDTLKTGDDRRIADVGRGLNTQWTSLPGGSESTMSERDFVDSYRQNLAKYKGEGRPDAAKKYGFSDDELGPISDPVKSEPSSLKPSSAPIGQDQESFSSRAGRALSDVGKSLADINSHLDPVKRLAPPAAQEVPKVDPDYKKLEDSLHTTLAPQFVDKVRNVYEAASPDERQRLMAQPGEVGAVAQYIDQKYQGADRVMSTNPDLAAVGDRREDITLRNRLNGMEDQTAKQMADREVRFNSAPITGQAQSTNFDFERAKELRDAGPIQRGAIQGAQDLKSQAAGLHFMAADLADSMGIPGAKGYGRAQLEARKKLQMGENEMGQAPNEFNRHLESAIRSTISNAPSLAAGVFSGGEAIPLLGLGAQVTGDEYANGVERGLSKEDALKRSVLFGSAEVLGEKFGFKDQVDLLKRASGGNWKNFEGLFVKNLGEQLAGEMGTTYAQFKTDKSKQFGLNQDATAKDLLNQMKDTVYQTVLQTSMMGAPGAIRAANSRLKESDAKHDQPFSDAFTPVNDTYRQIIGTRIGALRNDPEFKEIMRHETNIDLSGMERAKAARQTLAERRSLNEVNKPSISGETNGQDANVSNSGNEGRERIPSETETGRTGRDGRVQSEQESTSPIISEYPTSNAQEANGSGAVNNAIEIGQPGEINGSSSAQSEVRQGSGNSDQSSQGVQLGRQGDRNSQEEAQVNRFFMKPSPEGVQIVDAADHVISTHPQFSDAIEAFDQLQANADNQQTQTATNKETSDELQTTSKAGSEGARFQNPEGRRQQASKGTEQGSRQEAVQQRNHGLNDREERASKLDLLAQEQDNLGNHSEAADWRQKAADFRSGNFVPEAYEDANHPTGNVGEDVSGSSGTVQNAASGESGADVSTGSLGRGTLSERSSGDVRGAVGGTLASEDSSVGGRALTDKEESELRGHNLVLKKLGRSELTPKQFLAEQSTKLQPAASNRTVTDQEVVDAYNSAVGKYNKRAATENAAIDARGVGESKKVPRSNVKPATTLPSSGSLQRRTAESIAKIFGHKVIFVESADGKPLDIDGSIVGSHPNHILLAADSKQPLSRVTFHELVHGLRRNAPEIYGQLVRNLREHYNPIKVAKHLKDRGYDSDLPGSTDDPNHFSDENRNEEEWVADHLSDIIHDHKALKALAERMDGQKQGSGKTFLQHLKDFYESLISKLRGQGFGTESAVASKHLKKSRDAVVEALAAYHQQKELERFSDRNSDDSELDIAESKRKEEPANKKSIPSEMLLINDLVAAKKLASSQNWQKGRDLKLALDERMNNAARVARVNLKSKDDFTLKYLTDLAARDATEAMKVNSNAVGWYDGTVKEALDIMSQVHPELKTDPQAKFAFIWATAVTSNGLKVDKNFELAEAAYDYYKANGRMPTNIGIGTAAGKINEGLALFNSMMKKHGFEALQKFMTTKYSVRDIQKTHGMKAGGEGMNTMVYGSAILGPKIGNGFFSNLYGNFDQLTMDRWLMRTFGRWTGNLVTIDQDAIKDKRKKLRALIRMMTPQERKAFKASTTVDLRLDRPADDLAADIAKASMEPKLRESMNRVGGRPSHEFVELLGKEGSDSPRESIGSEIRKMGNGLAKNIDGQNEAPGGSKERDFIRAVFSGALERLQKQYPKLTMADLQALLWYPEKRLYDSAKVDESKESYEDDEAPDYANAAEKIARRKGIDVARKRVAPTGRTARVGGGERGLDEGSDFREDSVDTSGPEERQNGLDDPQLVFSNRVKPAPKRTVTAYKLFRVEKSRPGELFPLFVKMREGATQAGSRIIEPSIPIGSWQDAEVGEQAASGKVKSRLGELAYRPGWHAGDLPLATHIGTNLKVVDGKRKPTVRAEDQVWAEVEFAADHNWQPEADKRGVNEAGKIIASRAHITDRMPEDGFYRYKTSPNMAGTWLIGGSMKINRILSDSEVSSINSSAGTKDLPREKPFDAEKYGFLDSYPDIPASNRRQTETPAFKKWFGDSKVVDENGKPLTVYHGTPNGTFNEFSVENISDSSLMLQQGPGFYFTDKKNANQYTKPVNKSAPAKAAKVYDVHLSLQKPLMVTSRSENIKPDAMRKIFLDGDKDWFFSNWIPFDTGVSKDASREEKVDAYVKSITRNGEFDQKFLSNIVRAFSDKAKMMESLRKHLQADGVHFTDSHGSIYVAWNPSQIKSATGNNGEFSPTNPDIRFSNRTPNPPFYSQLARGFESSKMDSMPASQWRVWLQGNKAKLGIKDDEIAWTGIDDFLNLKGKEKLTKADIASFLKDNGVQVKEVMKGGVDEMSDEAVTRAYESIYGDSLDSDGDPMPIDEMRGMIRDEIEHTDSRDAARYEQYALPGGSNYRELLLTLPEGQKQLTWQWFDPDSGEFEQGFATQQEAIDARPSISAVVSRFESNHGPQTYYSGHWEEPNVLAHIRFNDRTDADGNKVLFIEELQSDWAQEGRKKGFALKYKPDDVLPSADRPDDHLFWYFDVPGNTLQIPKSYYPTKQEAKAYILLEKRTNTGGTEPAPFVTDTKAWVSLALKRIIRYAAEGGYDKVAFANGEQSADRYDLSKQIDEIRYLRNSSKGTVTLEAIKGRDHVFNKNNIPIGEVEDIVGKEIAKKVADDEGVLDKNSGYKSLSGLDLKVGGEGMKSFYDKIVPQVANEVLKKVGGGRMESVEIDTRSPEDDSWYEEPTDKDVLKQAGFVITPAMRDKALDGMPLFSNRKNVLGDTPLATWTSPKVTPIDNLIYTLQDKLVDTKRVQEAITAAQRLIADEWNPYQKELLYHGRTAKLTDDFLSQEVRPLFKSMEEKGVSMDELEEYLHNRHAEERNNQIASINPGMPDGGSGIETQDALNYFAMLPFDKATDLEDLADLVDKISKGTKKLLVSSGLEAQQTIDAWDNAYKYYVPLQREELEISPKGQGTGSGHSIKGSSSKRATGSKRKVVDILANLMMQRERAIVRSEKNKVATALYGLAIQNENSGFWLPVNPDAIKDPQQVAQDLLNMGLDQADIDGIMAEPTETAIDSKTGLVIHRINPRLRNMDNVLATRINGKDRFLFFSKEDERSVRMVAALKNLDEDGLGTILTYFRKVTRWISAINTQYNPVFGVVNLARDVQGGMLNLSSTPLAGKQLAVLKNVGPAMKGIYSDLRSDRKNKGRSSSSWSTLWEEYQGAGGRTGYRDAYRNSADRAEALKKEIARIQEGTLKRFGRGIFDWLSDYNDTLENAIRLSAYRVAKDNGMSKDQAAALAKNLTVNFNKKGQIASQAGSLYAFFNAGIQGNFRLGQTLSGNAGKKILAGGLILGAAQAALLAAAGFDDDEPPEFTKERNLIIPVGGSKYITIPLPLGFHVIPNTSRILTELVIDQGKDAGDKLINLLGSLADAFDPMGFSGFSYQTLSPSATDPLVALAENRNSFGREIYKKDRSSLDPSPGFARMKDTATGVSKVGAYVLNLISGGTDYKPGAFSPTPDQIDYLVGQATGGVGREIQKTAQFVSSTINGEDIPPHKIPLVGRFYGDAKSQASETSRFYKNLKELNAHEREIKGRIKDGKDIKAYQEEHPEAHMVSAANKVEKMLTELKTRKRLMIAKGASREEVKALEGEIASRIKQFNDDVKSRSQK